MGVRVRVEERERGAYLLQQREDVQVEEVVRNEVTDSLIVRRNDSEGPEKQERKGLMSKRGEEKRKRNS